jgi:CheY-like chemotaxis protein
MINKDKIAILCLDDERIILDSLKIQFEKEFKNNYLFEYAQEPEEAIEIIDELIKEKINLLLVISDYQMPSISGDLFVEILHAKLPSVNIIMLTGQMPNDLKLKLLNKNIVLKVISKPWNESELISLIYNLVAHE